MNMMAGDTCKRRRSSPRSPSFEAASGVKNFPAKDALADKMESYSESQSREGGREAEKAKGKRRQISPEINLLQRQKSVGRTGPSRLS